MNYDIGEAFQKIEEEMIASMSRNLKRHLDTEEKEGLNYSMWQAEQLAALNEFKINNSEKFSEYFSTINDQIEELLQKANDSGKMEQEAKILKAIQEGWSTAKPGYHLQGSFFKINDRKMNALINATKKDMAKAEHAMLRMSNDVYRKTIFNAGVFYNSGAGTLQQCVDMATKDFLSKGITCVEYANGARVGIDAYSRMALRTAQIRAYLQGESTKRDEWGVNTVIVNKRGVACPKCLKWVGKVYYDDVYSSLPVKDDKYTKLSTAIEGGLYHPNCKDIHTTYFEGITTKPKPMTQDQVDEANRVYALEQRQRYNERMIRKYKRLSEGSIDPENKAKYEEKLVQWQAEQNQFVKANRDVLKRRYELERVFKLPDNLQYGSNSYDFSQDIDDTINHEHTWIEEITKQPTCEEPGEKVIKCSECGEVKEAIEIPALGHDWFEAGIIDSPTCTDPGMKLWKCTRCDAEKEEVIPATGHSWGADKIIPPDCKTEGYTCHTCIICGKTEKIPGSETPALGHDYGEWTITKQPTTTAIGKKTRVCKRCGYKQYYDIPKLKAEPSTGLEAREQRIISDKAKLLQEKDIAGKQKYTIFSGDVTLAEYETKISDISAKRSGVNNTIDSLSDAEIDKIFADNKGDLSKASHKIESIMGLEDKRKYGMRYSELTSQSDPKAYIKDKLKAYKADQQQLIDKLDAYEAAGKKYLDYSKQITDLDDQLKAVRKDIMAAKGIDPDAMRSEITSIADQISILKKSGGTDSKLESLLASKIDDFEKIRARYDLPELGRIRTSAAAPRTKSAAILDNLQAHADKNKSFFESELRKAASSLGVSEDEARKKISEALADITEECDIGMRIKCENLEKVLQENDGGFKSLFEVGRSGGCSNFNARGGGEVNAFGFKKNVPDAGADTQNRPVYGMMIPKLDSKSTQDHIDYITRGPGSWYGDGVTCVINKDMVRNNASFTLGDSLDYQYKLCGSTFAEPTFNGSFGGGYGGLNVKELINTNKSAADRLIENFSSSDEYFEVQIHGKENHSSDIIEKVYFKQSAANRAKSSGLLSKLDAKKIPYEILK